MGKNLDALKEAGDHFTEETLKKIVAADKGIDQGVVEILSWDVETISGKGDNYLSVVNKVRVESKAKDQVLETRLIVKSLPRNLFRRKLLRSSEYFGNEITFYDKIATKFKSYLSAKEQDHLLCIPRCYAYHLDGENDFIALEDVTCRGYDSIPRQSCLSYGECKQFLEAMARFHGISFAFKDERKEEFDGLSSLLSETFYRTDVYETSLKLFYDDLFRVAKDALTKEYPGSEGEAVFNACQPDDLFEKTVEMCTSPNTETSVISQGDTWAPNFMVRRVESGQPDVLIIDFQIARCASPVLDVIFFIYQCTDKSVREGCWAVLLDDYYTELCRTMEVLGADPDKLYPKDVFRDEVQKYGLYGLMFALVNIPLSLVSENQVFDLDSIKEEVADIGDLDSMPNLEKSEDRRRLADVILHAVEKGYI
ncbi:uncharacterized protein LOC106643983 [Copidosoma floridanum]|uniref:uncharacterized protein LOC106643983 n=1 Tax=Copidosoma floridanum TaxID=29053 RepID=UPI0006C96539|nr:uncharacterized protein LOC106643983 [Copidosoma floridanum]XP_014214811.1 uncharacterized protein LOC106643983 [Copidosoma floridanum]